MLRYSPMQLHARIARNPDGRAARHEPLAVSHHTAAGAWRDEEMANDDEGLKTYAFEPDETELVNAITRIVRDADADFQKAGGSSRHWVRDHFLPGLRADGWRIVKLNPES